MALNKPYPFELGTAELSHRFKHRSELKYWNGTNHLGISFGHEIDVRVWGYGFSVRGGRMDMAFGHGIEPRQWRFYFWWITPKSSSVGKGF